MNRFSRFALAFGALALVLSGAACADDGGPAAPDRDPAPLLLSVVPEGGATDVPVDQPVTVEFDHAMAAGMEAYADLHEGDLAGPPVAGTWSWSADRTRLTFTPDAPFRPNTVYVIHLGGGMMDADDMPVDFQEHGEHMGGEWATEQMMHDGWSGGPGMAGPGMDDGMHDPDGQPYQGHMEAGWQHANGSYGMAFAFRTAG